MSYERRPFIPRREQERLSVLILILSFWSTLAACHVDPDRAKLKYFRSGEKYLKGGKYQEAAIQFRNAIQLDQEYAEAHYQLSRTYVSLRDSASALRELKKTVALEPTKLEAHLHLALLLLARGAYEDAQSHVAQVLKADPTNAQAHAILGQKHALRHDVPSAVVEFQQAIELDPRRIEYYEALGAICQAAGKAAEAEAVYKRAAQMNPESLPARMLLANFYFSQGDMAQAETAALDGLKSDSDAVPPRILLTRIYVALNRVTDAESLCMQLKSMAPDNPDAYQALALLYRSTGQKEKAAAEFHSLLVSKPADLSIKQRLIETLIDLQRLGEAAALNLEILKTMPENPSAMLSQSRILLAERRYQEALTTLQKVVALRPQSAHAHYLLGVAQMSLGLSGLAKRSFAQALELNPQMTEAVLSMTYFAKEADDHNAALRLANSALGVAPNTVSATVARAQALLLKGEARQAETVLEHVLRRDPASLPALAILLNLRIAQGKIQSMAQRISQLIEERPQNSGLYFLLGVCHFSLNNLEHSEANVRQALRLDPRTPQAHTLLANIHLAKGSTEEAKADLQAAIEATPHDVANYLTLATQYEKEGKWDQAKQLCERAHKVDPASPLVANQLAYLYLEHGGDATVALSLAQQAKQELPDSPNVADTLGWAYYKLGITTPAIKQLKQCVQTTPTNSTCHYHLGMAYIAAGESSDAKQSLRQALEDPTFRYPALARAALSKISTQLP